MRIRTITSAIILAIMVPILILSEYVIYPIALAIFSLMAVFEFLRVFGIHKKPLLAIPAYFIALALPLGSYMVKNVVEHMPYILASAGIIFAYMLYAMVVAVFSKGAVTISTVAETFFAVTYVVISFTGLCLIRYFPQGMWHLGLVFIGAWICDSGAYIFGSLFGRHKLIPSISPKKTVEGAIGGVLLTVAAAALYGFILETFSDVTVNYLVLVIAAFILSLVAQLGDLIASLIKREHGVKDYGSILPGHGGIMDRFDSVLAVSSVLMIICLLCPPFT